MKRNQRYSDDIYQTICKRLSDGQSLRQACKDKGFPTPAAVCYKVVEEPAFAEQYARARQAQAVLIADQLIEIADDESKDVFGELQMPNMAAIMRSRVRLDTRKWYLSKVLPKIYGDKKIISGDPDNPILILADRLSSARKRLGRPAPKLIEAEDLVTDDQDGDESSET